MNIHIYEFDGGSMPGTVNGYWEIYLSEYGVLFLDSADNSDVFDKALEYANEFQTDIVIHTLSKWEMENV